MSAEREANLETMTSLLRGQIAAVESYDRAMDSFEDARLLTDLGTIREEHILAEALLREKVYQMGGSPVESPGPWCRCAAAIGETTAEHKTTNPCTALAALRQGEEQVANEFENSLQIEKVDPECKHLIRTNLLPTTRKHVEELNRLMGGMT